MSRLRRPPFAGLAAAADGNFCDYFVQKHYNRQVRDFFAEPDRK